MIRLYIGLFVVALVVLSGCTPAETANSELETTNSEPETMEKGEPETKNDETAIAVFAGGCFWCMESGFEGQAGVKEVISGYTGGETANPTYEEVLSKTTGHYEAVEVHYDPKVISYEELLKAFWIQIDPTDAGGQFADRGPQYTTAIFYETDEQKRVAEASMQVTAKSFDDPIVTEILPAEKFYPAEDYHQDYYKKQTLRYKTYEKLSGRKDFVEENKQRLAQNTVDDTTDATAQVEETTTYTGELLAGTTTPYLAFNKADYDKAISENKIVLLYFFADWCPSCIAEQGETYKAFDELRRPDIVGFRVNYRDGGVDDYEEQLAREHGVSYQHTKVILHNGERVLKVPNTWKKERYLNELEAVK